MPAITEGAERFRNLRPVYLTGLAARVAKMSLASSSTGIRFVVANAAPVSMLVEPGPIDAVQAMACRRLRIRE